MNNLPVTCIIPVRNGAATIEYAIRSAIDAGCEYVWVYDDASTDNTRSIVDTLANKYPYKVCYAHGLSVGAGVNFARNFLIDNANDGLIICLDADDTLWDITALREAWQPMTWCYGNHNELNQGDDFGTLVKGVAAGSLSRKNITGISFLFAKEDWQRVGGFDVDFAFAEDWSFQCALTNGGVKPVYVDTTVYTRIMRSEGNERSVLAHEYWTFYRAMARRKYPQVFAGMG